MATDFERSALRELDQIHGLIKDLVTELRSERHARESLDSEVSELRLRVDRLQNRPARNPRKALARDSGLVVSTGTLLAVLNWWLTSQSPPPPPARVPAPIVHTAPGVP